VKDSEDIITELIRSPLMQSVGSPTLLHADLHKSNIFVSETEPTTIMGLIDWQSTSIEPAFMYANETPDFTTPADDITFLEYAVDTFTDEGQQTDVEKIRGKTFCCAVTHSKFA
jgi:predicted unusual protein kinase regulating ubiquinone biosynthesis (AarF/ABC1/UbiB family)